MTLSILLAAALTLAEQGKPVAEIVTGTNPTKTVQFAARELKAHLDGIAGSDFKIVADAAVANGLVLRSPAAALALSGEDKREFGAIDAKWLPGLYDKQGTLYAVYDFLERACGVVWADSSDYGTVLPKNPTLTVDSDFKVKPPFMAYRGGHPIDQDRYEPLMWRRKSAGEKRYNDFAYGNKTQKEIEYQQRLFMRRKRLGGEFMPANHSFYFWYERFWAKKEGWKGQRFERKRPELFAKGYVGEPPQLCYMNPETIEQTVEDIGRYFTDDAFVKRFYGRRIWGDDAYCLEPMDNRSFCKCEACAKYYEANRPEKSRHSTYWFTFVNAVAKEVKKRFPGKRISTLAYMTHEGLPTDVTLEDNVLVYFCFGGNRVPYKKDSIANAYKLMGEWRAAYPNQPLALWLYNTFPLEIAHNGGYHCFPGFFADAAEDEYRHFKELNIRVGIFHCGFNGEVDNYMQCAWMIDPDRKAVDLLREYFSGCGKAAEPLIEFYRTVERRYCDPTIYPAECWHQTLDLAWGLLGSEEIMKRLEGLMAEAEKKAETPEEKARVALFRLSVWDYMKEGYDTYRLRQSAPVPHWKGAAVPDAGGDAEKVDWSRVSVEDAPLYVRGCDKTIPVRETIRWAYDKTHLYLELTEHLAPSNLVNSAMIAPVDTWEITLSHQRAQPFRHYLSAPDGRMKGLSYGEVNWRQGVWASESGDVSYGARAKTDLSLPDRWTIRYAFPLEGMLEKPVAPGGRLYVNIARVMNVPLSLSIPGVEKQHFGYSIFTLVTHTTVRTADRWGELELIPAAPFRYSWRGFLLDECRHFFGKEVVKQYLDRMEKMNLNVFHWHLTEDQAWRLDIPGMPELVQYGAKRSSTPTPGNNEDSDGKTYGPFFYTAADVKEIVDYAAARGIRVVPEIEIPGHSRALLAAHPEFACEGVGATLKREPWTHFGICKDVLCAGNDEALRFYERVLDEVMKMFPGEFIHIGGDECPKDNWKKCPKCQARIKALGLKDEHALQGWVTTRMANYVASKGRRAIGWDEVLEGGDLPKSTVIQSWRGAKGGIAAAKLGHDVIMSPCEWTYFTFAEGLPNDPYKYRPWVKGKFLPAAKMHAFDPEAGVPEDLRGHIIGAECCAWSEILCDVKELEYKTLNRLPAFAEAVSTSGRK